MERVFKQFVIYIFVFYTCNKVSGVLSTPRLLRKLKLSVASPTLPHVPILIGGPDRILPNPINLVRSFIPKPRCGFNCRDQESMERDAYNEPFQGHPSHPHGYNPHNVSPPHPHGFHVRPPHIPHSPHSHPHWQKIRQPQPFYGPPNGNIYPQPFNPLNEQYINMSQHPHNPQQNFQSPHYQPNANPSEHMHFNIYQQALPNQQNANYQTSMTYGPPHVNTVVNGPIINPPNTLAHILNQSNRSVVNPPNNRNGPITNQPNIIETTTTQTYNPFMNQFYQPLPNQPNIMEIIKENKESSLLPNSTADTEIFSAAPNSHIFAKNNEKNVSSLEQSAPKTSSIPDNQQIIDFIYPDSMRYIKKPNNNMNIQDMYPPIDIRRRRSVTEVKKYKHN